MLLVEPVVLHAAGRQQSAWLLNISVDGARVSGPTGLPADTPGALQISGLGLVEARIRAETADGYRILLFPTPEQREQIIARVHTSAGAPGTRRADFAVMVRELARSLTR